MRGVLGYIFHFVRRQWGSHSVCKYCCHSHVDGTDSTGILEPGKYVMFAEELGG